jgi:hypothetical protein
VQRVEESVAAFEERAERGEGQVAGLARRRFEFRLHQQIKDCGTEYVRNQIVRTREFAARKTLRRPEPRQMGSLRRAGDVGRRIFRIALGGIGGFRDQ